MDIGYIVGIIVAIFVIICGCVSAIYAKKNHKKCRWAVFAIILGVVALITAYINYNSFGN